MWSGSTSRLSGFRPWQRLAPVIAIAAAGCLSAGCQDDLDLYYPLDAGLTWQYRATLAQGDVTAAPASIANLETRDVLGRSAVPQRSQMFGQTLVRYLTNDDSGIVEFAQQVGDTPVLRDPPNYVLKAPLEVGTSWSSTWQSSRDGAAVTFPTVKVITATNETITVPAGTFIGCLHVRITGKGDIRLTNGPATIEVVGDEWYAADVGYIKGTFRETVDAAASTTELALDLETFDRSR
jgi:hypothetical protein